MSLSSSGQVGAVGETALLHSLCVRLELNGQRGTLLEHLAERNRWKVRLPDGKLITVPVANLCMSSTPPADLGFPKTKGTPLGTFCKSARSFSSSLAALRASAARAAKSSQDAHERLKGKLDSLQQKAGESQSQSVRERQGLKRKLSKADARIHVLEQQLEPLQKYEEAFHWQAIARLPRTTCYRELALEPLLSVDPRRILIERLFTGSCARHRKELQSDEFCQPPQLQVQAVEQVVNGRLWRQYLQCLEDLEGLRRMECCSAIPPLQRLKLPAAGGEPDLNEVLLFHGSTASGIEAILKGGFDPQRGGESAGKLFGVATYFAANASKSDIYTEERSNRLPQHAVRKLFVARVALGESQRVLRGCPGLHRAPDGFDSVWADSKENGGCVDHVEAMIYTKGQAIPAYLVSYVHAGSCRCAECLKRPRS